MDKILAIPEHNQEQIREFLQKLPRTFSVNEVQRKFEISKKIANALLILWVGKGWVLKSHTGFYTLKPCPISLRTIPVEHPWVIAEKIYSPCHIGAYTSAKYWKLIEQDINTVIVFTSKSRHKNTQNILGEHIKTFYVPPNRMFGINVIQINEHNILISNPTRTTIECIDKLDLSGGIRNIIHILLAYIQSEHKDMKLLFSYAEKHYKRNVILKKLGCLLELFAPEEIDTINLCKQFVSCSNDKFNDSLNSNIKIYGWYITCSLNEIRTIRSLQKSRPVHLIDNLIKPPITYTKGRSIELSEIKVDKNYINSEGYQRINKEKFAEIIKVLPPIFCEQEASKILNITPPQAWSMLSKARKKHWIVSKKTKVTLYMSPDFMASNPEEIPWMILEKLYPSYYIGTESAAEYWGFIERDSEIKTITYCKNRPRCIMPLNIDDNKFLLTWTRKENIFGICTITHGKKNVFISDPSRTVIDLLGRPCLVGGINCIIDILLAYLNSNYKETELLCHYATRLRNSNAILKRLGFLLELFTSNEISAINQCRKHICHGSQNFDPKSNSDIHIPNWGLMLSKDEVAIIRSKQNKPILHSIDDLISSIKTKRKIVRSNVNKPRSKKLKNIYLPINILKYLDKDSLTSILKTLPPVFSHTDVMTALNLKRWSAWKWLSKWNKNGWIVKVAPSLYMLPSLPVTNPLEAIWIIIERIFNSYYYIGALSAAYHWGLIKINPRDLIIYYYNRRPRRMRLNLHDSHCILTAVTKKNTSGLQTIQFGGKSVSITDPSRTVIDLLARPHLANKNNNFVDMFITYLHSNYKNLRLMCTYAKHHSQSGSIFKRLGYLLENFAPLEQEIIEVCRKNISTGCSIFDYKVKSDKIITRWRIWISSKTMKEIQRKRDFSRY
jgi:predicted transcriptional regulator of viral defense system